MAKNRIDEGRKVNGDKNLSHYFLNYNRVICNDILQSCRRWLCGKAKNI